MGLGCSLQGFEGLAGGGAGGASGSAGAGGDSGEGGGGGDAGDGGSGGNGGTDVGGSGGDGGSAGDGSGDAGPAIVYGNLFPDPSFEEGHGLWVGFGNSLIVDVADMGRTGQRCISSSNRTQSWEGPSYVIGPLVVPGEIYNIGGWVRVEEGQQAVGISLKTVCDESGETYGPIVNAVAATPEWTELTGMLPIPTCTLRELRVYFEGAEPGADFFIDDVNLSIVE